MDYLIVDSRGNRFAGTDRSSFRLHRLSRLDGFNRRFRRLCKDRGTYLRDGGKD
jgi:hypothetical protein